MDEDAGLGGDHHVVEVGDQGHFLDKFGPFDQLFEEEKDDPQVSQEKQRGRRWESIVKRVLDEQKGGGAERERVGGELSHFVRELVSQLIPYSSRSGAAGFRSRIGVLAGGREVGASRTNSG